MFTDLQRLLALSGNRQEPVRQFLTFVRLVWWGLLGIYVVLGYLPYWSYSRLLYAVPAITFITIPYIVINWRPVETLIASHLPKIDIPNTDIEIDLAGGVRSIVRTIFVWAGIYLGFGIWFGFFSPSGHVGFATNLLVVALTIALQHIGEKPAGEDKSAYNNWMTDQVRLVLGAILVLTVGFQFFWGLGAKGVDAYCDWASGRKAAATAKAPSSTTATTPSGASGRRSVSLSTARFKPGWYYVEAGVRQYISRDNADIVVGESVKVSYPAADTTTYDTHHIEGNDLDGYHYWVTKDGRLVFRKYEVAEPRSGWWTGKNWNGITVINGRASQQSLQCINCNI